MNTDRNHTGATDTTVASHSAGQPGTHPNTPEGSGEVKGGWRIVAGREIAVKLTDKAWLISTLVTTLLIIGVFVGTALIGGHDEPTTVATTTPQASAMVNAANQAPSIPGLSSTKYTSASYPDENSGRAAVESGDADYYLNRGQDGQWVLVTDGAPGTNSLALQGVVASAVMNENAMASGTSMSRLSEGTEVKVESVGADVDDANMAQAAGLVFAMIFYMSALVFGITIANSVVEEKQSRLAEIIATSVPMSSMLAGKVIGNSVLAFAQVVLYVAIALVGISFTDIGAMLPSLPLAVWWFLAFFVVGFVAMSSMWAVAGSLASRQEDVSYTSTPMMALVIGAFMIPFFVRGTWLVVCSYIPILSSVAMPMRVVAGEAAWWEPIVALAITVLAAVVLIKLGSRLYRNSLLQTGGRMSYREAFAARD